MAKLIWMPVALAAAALLAGCDGPGPENGGAKGDITATLDGTAYTLKANCYEGDEEITVLSDDDGGVEIAARQMGSQLNLDVVIDGAYYSTPNLDEWERTPQGLVGSGRLYLDDADDYRAYPVTFEATCP